MHPGHLTFSADRRPFSRLLSDLCRSSRLDARENPQGRGLHARGLAKNCGRSGSVEVDVSPDSRTFRYQAIRGSCKREAPCRYSVVTANWPAVSCAVLLVNFPCDVGPNISGTATLYRGDKHPFGNFSVTGVFRQYGEANGTTYTATDRGTQRSGFQLDASLASDIFGDSSSVQPASLRFLPCIKL